MLGLMSAHYEVVFSLCLRDDTPADALDELRWHLGLAGQRPGVWALGYDTPQLRPDEASPLPGGEAAALCRQAAGWGLHTRLRWADERWAEVWWQVVAWLSRYAGQDGYAGFYRAEHDEQPTVLVVRGGRPYLSEFTGQARALSS
jgi:hypothetical protein